MTYSALAMAQASCVRAFTTSTGNPCSAPATPSSSQPRGRITYVKPAPAIIVQAGGTPLDRRERLPDRLHRLELELPRLLDAEEVSDPLRRSVDVVGEAGVRVTLDVLEEDRRATVQALLDGCELEVGVDLDVRAEQFPRLLQVLQRGAQAGDVLLADRGHGLGHRRPPRGIGWGRWPGPPPGPPLARVAPDCPELR